MLGDDQFPQSAKSCPFDQLLPAELSNLLRTITKVDAKNLGVQKYLSSQVKHTSLH